MTTKLVWPATFLASFVLAAACGGGSTDSDGTGGEGGEDGSGGDTVSSGGSTGGQNVGGEGGEGGLGGGGPIVIVPETCSDSQQNEGETDVDCGGPDCNPCADDASCNDPSDCESGVCRDGACIAPDCGDEVVNGDEECDPGRETEGCNVDCTFTVCGDGYVNEAGEDCERDEDLGPWQRCGRKCLYGVDLDGTWRTQDLVESNSPWEILAPSPGRYSQDEAGTGAVIGLPSFHYAEQPSIYDVYSAHRYEIETDTWIPFSALSGVTVEWANGAVDSEFIWIPRAGTVYRLTLSDEIWEPLEVAVPDANGTLSAAVYDGEGFIWYVGLDSTLEAPDTVLVRFDPATATYQGFAYSSGFPGFDMYETRVAYDPVSNKVLLAGYGSSTFLIFDIATEEFSQSSEHPDGPVKDYTCQDRAGGVYVGGSAYLRMYRYDIGTDEFTPLPDLPSPQDNWSSCVVSETGYLYTGSEAWTGSNSSAAFRRLRLNHR